MIKAAIMVIWFGTAEFAQFDVERFESLAECEAAKVAILARADSQKRWLEDAPTAKTVFCAEIGR